MSELLTRRRFTVEEYHRMGKAGIPPEDNPCRVARSRASRSVRSAQHRRRRGTRAGLVLSAPGWQNSTTSFAAVVRASPQTSPWLEKSRHHRHQHHRGGRRGRKHFQFQASPGARCGARCGS